MRTLALAIAVVAAFGAARADDKEKGATKAAGKSANAGKKVIVERVVAVVNNQVILESELRARMVPVMAQVMQIGDEKERKRRLDKLTSQTLDDMVSEELIVQAAEQAKIDVESSEIQAALDEIKQNNGLDDAGLAQALAQQGYTLQNYKADLRRQIMRLRAVNQLVAPKVQVTDDDVRARYDQLQRRSEAVEAVQLAHILIKLASNPPEQQLAEAKNRAAQAVSRVRAGEDFAAVAKDMSEDASTNQTGGQLGWFQRGSLANPEWEPVVFAMQKGDVRGPVSGPQGFHVFYVTDVKQNQLQPFPQMKDQLKNELRRRELEKQTQTWIEELRKKAYIDIKL
jgi:parvulin-like peptidyl-prolyl isomerase